MKLPYKRPRVEVADLRTPVRFYEYVPNTGPEPGEGENALVYECFAKIDEVWAMDIEQAKTNNTLSDVTLTIRETMGEFIPTVKHRLEIDMIEYTGKRYNVKHVQPDAQKRDYIKVIAGLVSD